MKYNLIRHINNIKKFDVKGDNIIVILEDNKIYFNDDILIEVSNTFNVGYFINNSFLIYGNLKSLIKYDFKNKKNEKLNPEWSYYWNSLYKDKVLISLNRRNDEKGERIADFHWFDLSNKMLGFKLFADNPQIRILNNHVIFFSIVTIKSHSIFTGESLWQTQINRNGEIFKILGIRADELIVCWKRGNMDFGLLGINIHTGEIAWNMDDNDLLNGYTLNFSPDENALFCVKNSGFKSYYLELDLLTKKTLRFDEIPKFFELGLIIDRIWVKENLIYFFARKGSKFSTVAGIMDYKTLEILWQEQIVVGSWAYLSDLQVDNDMLYILDGEGVLHIFEREASE